MTKRIAILGSTGSIGKAVIDVVRKFPDEFEIVGLSANQNTGLLTRQAKEFRVKHIAVYDEKKYRALKSGVGNDTICFPGMEGLINLAELDIPSVTS